MANEPYKLDQALVNKAQGRLGYWYGKHAQWQATHWGVGITGLIASAVSAATTVSGGWAPCFALVSTLCLSVIAFLTPQVHAERYIAAWRVVYAADIRYSHKPSEANAEALIDAIERGELIIQGVEKKQDSEKQP